MSRGFSLSSLMALKTIKTSLPTLNTNKVKVLETKAGSTERITGRSWMTTRQRILIRDKFTCKCCGLVRNDHEVDHIIPLEQGGSNDQSNLQTLCNQCHTAKTVSEAKARWGRAG